MGNRATTYHVSKEETMAGNITKRGEDRWQIKVFLGRDPETGKQLVHNKTIHGTKRDAQAYMNRVLHERDRGIWVEPSNQTVGDYLDRWLRDGDTSRDTTRDYNAWVVSKYIRPTLGSIPLGRLSAFDVQGLYNSLSRQGLAPASVRRFHNILSSALRTACRWGHISKNPAADVRLPKPYKAEMKVLCDEEARRFLETAANCRHATLWRLAIETGMRPEEYLGLRWRDVDCREGILMVQSALKRIRGGGWKLGDLKTTSSRRRIRLSAELIDQLVEHRMRQTEAATVERANWRDHDLVFHGEYGEPLRVENLTRRHFRCILAAAGLPTLRLYDLRHTSATLALRAGVHVKVVSERLGHADVSLTLNTYSHVLPDMQRDATVAIAGLLRYPEKDV